jgi:HK97 family phage major capsid protein
MQPLTKQEDSIMGFINVHSTELKRQLDIMQDDLQSLRGRTAGRTPSNAEQKAIEIREKEIEATRERFDQVCKAEDQEAEARKRAAFSGWTPEAMDQMNDHLRSLGGLAGAEQVQERAAKVQAVIDMPGPSQVNADSQRGLFGRLPGFLSTSRGNATSDPARRTIEQAHKRGLLPAAAATVAERLVSTGDNEARGLASRWAIATGADKYASAFFKLMSDPQRGHMLWTEEERAAYQAVEAVKRELRGMSTAGGYGGALLPLFLDPAILLTSDGSNNPLRQVARVVQTTSNTWQGVTSAGVTAEWKTEAAQASDATPATAPAAIPVYFGDAYVPFSFEVQTDGLDFENQLALLLMDAADQLQATAFTTGSGVGQPTGFVTALAGTSSEKAIVGTYFEDEDVVGLQNSLPARFQARAQWMAALPTINHIAAMETANGNLRFPNISDGMLCQRPLNECSNMASWDDVRAATSPDNYILAYGAWDNFVIVDRIGTTLEIIPNVVGANGRPTGERGAFMWFRTGSDVAVPEAFRILNCSPEDVS